MRTRACTHKLAPAFCYSYDVRFRETRWAMGRCFKFAKFLYLDPYLFGYVHGFSLNCPATDIAITVSGVKSPYRNGG